MEKITLTCSKCGKKVHTNEDGIKSRMRLFKDKSDFDKNFKCNVCKGKSKLEKK